MATQRAKNPERHRTLVRASRAKYREKYLATARKARPERGLRPFVRAGWLFDGAKFRAAKLGVSFDLDRDVIEAKLRGGVCDATSMAFDMRVGGPYALTPSLDRIDPTEGYTRTNVQVVVWAFNAARGTWGDAVMLAVLEAYKASALAKGVPT